MNSPNFLVAKYVDNVKRMEPTNIGVLLWTPKGSGVCFLGQNKQLEISQKPKFIKQRNFPVYCDWVTYWRKKVVKFGGKSLEAFQHELLRSRGENYIITKGGFIPRDVTDIADAVDQLYSELVAGPDRLGTENEQPKVQLRAKCKKFFKETKISDHENFHETYLVKGDVLGIPNRIPFSFGIGVGGENEGLFESTKAVFQMTDLSNPKDWQSAITGFTSLKNTVAKKKRASMVDIPTDQLSGDLNTIYKTIEKTSVVINLSQMAEATQIAGEMGLST